MEIAPLSHLDKAEEGAYTSKEASRKLYPLLQNTPSTVISNLVIFHPESGSIRNLETGISLRTGEVLAELVLCVQPLNLEAPEVRVESDPSRNPLASALRAIRSKLAF